MESYGYDMFLFWTSECKNFDIFKKFNFPLKGINMNSLYENCHHQENTTSVLKLNILNQFDQPPGVEIYNSLNRTLLEFNNTKSPMQIIKEYFNSHPNLSAKSSGQVEMSEGYDNNNSGRIGIHKYGNSNFRHKDNRQGLLKDFSATDNFGNYQDIADQQKPYNAYYDTGMNIPEELDDYNSEDEVNNKERNFILKNVKSASNRDPRSKSQMFEDEIEGSLDQYNKSQLTNEDGVQSEEKDFHKISSGIYDYKNIILSKNRLLHDLSNSPDEILSDTFYKNFENRLRTSKFEQRDLISHSNKKAEEESINEIIEEHRKRQQNSSFNLWNLESEKEDDDRKNNYWRSRRRKRQSNYSTYESLRKATSVGAITNSLQVSNDSNSIDIIFLTYWQPTKYEPRENLEEELAECVEEKLASIGEGQYQKTTDDEKRTLFLKECVMEQSNFKRQFPYFNDIYKMNLGQMTVYRLKIVCQCNLTKENERCAKFSPSSKQTWPSHLGRNGDGVFSAQNANIN
ncbi:hypothetical protein HHI36_018917 [Cryptolaemus montrouzieri]|uniref:Uncharacterized protein n=1 Tax=Cryptolaemus montrouzieri TaxID=559131 RepID=A0ABD2P1K6_9CUCU